MKIKKKEEIHTSDTRHTSQIEKWTYPMQIICCYFDGVVCKRFQVFDSHYKSIIIYGIVGCDIHVFVDIVIFQRIVFDWFVENDERNLQFIP